MFLKSLRSIAVRLLLVDFSVFRLKTCLIKIHRTKTNKQQSWRTLHDLVMHTLYIYCGTEVRRSSVNLPSGYRYLKVNFLSKELTREKKWFSSTKVQCHTGKTYANIIGSPNFLRRSMGKFICFVVYSKLDKQSPFGVDCLFGIF